MSTTEKIYKLLVAIRIRGNVGVRRSIKDTLGILRLFKVNHAVLLDNRKSNKGMLQKAKDYITWGQIDKDTLVHLLMKRGKLPGNKSLNDEHIKKYTKYKSIQELAEALIKFELQLKDVPYLKPVFRLHPPRKGFKFKKKRPYKDVGELGNRDIEINPLLSRMI